MRRIFALALCLMLGGCVLQSTTPNFKEAEGVALPGSLGTTFVTEYFIDGVWKAEDASISFVASGKHYVVRNEKNEEIGVLFVALGKGVWVMQAAEKGKPPIYVLAEAKDGMLLLRPLLCDALKKRDDVKTLVRFEGNDCFLKVKAGLDAFKLLGAKADAAKMRLRRVKS